MASRQGPPADVAVRLWQPLSSTLIAIVGEGGFNALFNRSLFLARGTFPWLMASDPLRAVDYTFSDLSNCLAGHDDPADTGKASQFLLLTFTDILASLIGESLTIDILSSAWSSTDSGHDSAGKEFPHE